MGELEDLKLWQSKWREYFLEFMIRNNDMDIENPLEVKDMQDELSIQLTAFMGW